jgi:hypothetical protein
MMWRAHHILPETVMARRYVFVLPSVDDANHLTFAAIDRPIGTLDKIKMEKIFPLAGCREGMLAATALFRARPTFGNSRDHAEDCAGKTIVCQQAEQSRRNPLAVLMRPRPFQESPKEPRIVALSAGYSRSSKLTETASSH